MTRTNYPMADASSDLSDDPAPGGPMAQWWAEHHPETPPPEAVHEVDVLHVQWCELKRTLVELEQRGFRLHNQIMQHDMWLRRDNRGEG